MTEQERLEKLARFSGLKRHGNSTLYWMGTRSFCHVGSWNPYKRWDHFGLVLEAWAKRDTWFYVLRVLSEKAFDYEPKEDFDPKSAGCDFVVEHYCKGE